MTYSAEVVMQLFILLSVEYVTVLKYCQQQVCFGRVIENRGYFYIIIFILLYRNKRSHLPTTFLKPKQISFTPPWSLIFFCIFKFEENNSNILKEKCKLNCSWSYIWNYKCFMLCIFSLGGHLKANILEIKSSKLDMLYCQFRYFNSSDFILKTQKIILYFPKREFPRRLYIHELNFILKKEVLKYSACYI